VFSGTSEKQGTISDSQVDLWKKIFPDLFNENNCINSKDAKTIIRDKTSIRNKEIKQITSIPETLFFGCNNLTELEFENNLISVIPPGVFNDCPDLKKIYFSNNQLSEIPDGLFANCKDLYEIYFSNNQLSKLPDGLFDHCPSLSRIYFDNNQLSEIPKGLFNKCTFLYTISFSNNQLSEIPNGLFANCQILWETNFRNNQLSYIPDGLFDHCPSLSRIFFENNQLSEIPKGLFNKCTSLYTISFSNNQLSEIPNGLFANCQKLRETNFRKNQLSNIPDGLFDHCPFLSSIYFDNNQLSEIPNGLFDHCPFLSSIYFDNNQLSEIPNGLFANCQKLRETNFSNNQLSNIPDRLFANCERLWEIYFSQNQLSQLPDGLFANCKDLYEIYFSNNQLSQLPDGLIANCKDLYEIYFSNNQLSKLPDGLFDHCPSLSSIYFDNNQLFLLQDRIFDKCTQLKNIDFSNNQLAKIPRRLFKNCHKLFKIDFSNNRIKMFHDDLISHCEFAIQSFNFEKNNIEAVSFSSLRLLSKCYDINFTDNFLYNSKSLYSLMFQIVGQNKYLHFDELDKYTNLHPYISIDVLQHLSIEYPNTNHNLIIFRNLDKSVVEKCFLAFYLSSSSKTEMSIDSLHSKFNQFLDSEITLLDLFISVFGEIDDSKIINLKKLIDNMILKDDKLENIEFLIRSEKSISQLCTRNISCHFDTFFPNTFKGLLSRVRQTNTKAADFKSEEELAFKSFCNYVAIKKEPSKIIFHLIDYTECFNIALKNKNLEIAKFVVILLRYYVMVWSDFENVFWIKDLNVSKRDECSMLARDALNKFNRNLFGQFEYIFENDLNEIVMFLMDIKKLDLLKPEQKKIEFHEKIDQKKPEQNKIEFLVYDIDRFNSKQTKPADRFERPKDGQKRTEFLFYLWKLVKDNDENLKHESVKQIFNEKWHEKAAIKYYFDLLMFIVFVVCYNINMELDGKSYVNTTFQLSVWYISLIFAVINLLLEVIQCLMHIIYRKFIQYANR